MDYTSDESQHPHKRSIDPFLERLIRSAQEQIARRRSELAAAAESKPQSDEAINTDPIAETECESGSTTDEQAQTDETIETPISNTARPIALLEREELEWIWPGRVPIGKVTVLAGLPGIGKSLVAIDWAARVSAGTGWPGSPEPREPASVLLVNVEDSPHDTILPRLAAAGGDASRVLTIDADRWDAIDLRNRKQVRLGECVELLEIALEEHNEIRLVVLDPISAFCSDIDCLNQTEVRVLLGVLGRIAARHRVAIVAVTHLTKSPTRESVDRALGALTFAASARAVWILAPHPDNPARRLMLPGKSNLAAAGTEHSFAIREGRIQWMKRRAPNAAHDDAHPLFDHRKDLNTPAVREAARWLKQQLTPGPQPARELRRDAIDCGISWTTLCRAKDVSKLRIVREGFGAQGRWHWQLPDSLKTSADTLPETAHTNPSGSDHL